MRLKAFGARGGSIREKCVVSQSTQTATCRTQYEHVLRVIILLYGGPLMVAQSLRCCATNREVAGSIPDGVIGILH
jgi:hypothetical protein